MQTNLPPLDKSCLDGCYFVSTKDVSVDLTADQAALVIDIVEVRYPKALEVLRQIADAEAGTLEGRIDNLRRIELAENFLASLESK